DLFNIMLKIFDDGVLTDGFGRRVDFSNTVIIMTSNLGTKDLAISNLGFGEELISENQKTIESKIMKSVDNAFSPELINRIDETIKTLEEIKTEKLAQVPENWKSQRALFEKQNKDLRSTRMKYRRNVDEAYEPIKTINGILKDTDALRNQRNKIESIGQIIMQQEPDGAMKQIKLIEKELGNIDGSSSIKSKISKARRALKGKNPNREKANEFWKEALTIFDKEMQWRQKALSELIQPLDAYDTLIKDSIGLRSQKKLGLEQAKSIAVCKSSHQDISLNF
ncbi:MAG: AAA family ATPase, partial [bacterium]